MFKQLLRAGLYSALGTAYLIESDPPLPTGPNPPKGKGKVMYRLPDPRDETPVKSKSLKRLLKQKGRK